MNLNKWENKDNIQYDVLVNEISVLSGINQQIVNDVLCFFEVYAQTKLQLGKSIKLKNGTYIQHQQLCKGNKIHKFIQFRQRTSVEQCFNEQLDKELNDSVNRYIQKRLQKQAADICR